MTTDMTSANFISFPSCSLRTKKIRFLSLDNGNQTVSTNEDLQKGTPLFLATDVLNGTAITPDNQPRIHARYSKLGLATKLMFPSGTKVSGLHGISRGVWFYSIQGVVKVTFEFHSSDHQIMVMDTLQDVWRKRHNASLLPLSITVKSIHSSRSKCTAELSTECGGMDKQAEMVENTIHSQLHDAEGQKDLRDISLSQKRHYTIVLRDNVPSKKRTLADFEKDNLIESSDPKSDCVDDRPCQQQMQRKYASDLSIHHTEEVSTDEEPCTPVFDRTKCWCHLLKSRLQGSATQVGCRERIMFGQELVTALEKFGERMCLMTDRELTLLCGMMNAVSSHHWNRPEGTVGGSPGGDCHGNSDTFLCAVAKWLGSTFHREVMAISERVEDFKLRNIDHINSLPQPERLVHTLFPKPMVEFVMCWVGTSNDEEGVTSSAGADAADSDCCRTQSSHGDKSKDDEDSVLEEHAHENLNPKACFPLVQFILEMANQTLISGMAHVIYPRLIQHTNI
ncbi:uncharacterized protein [Diadema setosum]|uniref:uncharacterized protein n=1 Tax=Diadema setosum TaxID=31175 RepID=UPI003B3ADF0E